MDGYGLADDSFAGELTDDRGFLCGEELSQEGRFGFTFACEPVDESFLGSIIERDISWEVTPAEDANLAHPFRADAAGGEIRDTPSFESDTGVGDVFGATQHGNTDRVHPSDGAIDEREQDVEIMNHEI